MLAPPQPSARFLCTIGLIGVFLVSGCALFPPPAPASKPEPAPTVESRAPRKGKLQTSVFVDNVALPAAMTFAPDGRMFFVEVFAGQVRVVENGALKPDPVVS